MGWKSHPLRYISHRSFVPTAVGALSRFGISLGAESFLSQSFFVDVGIFDGIVAMRRKRG